MGLSVRRLKPLYVIRTTSPINEFRDGMESGWDWIHPQLTIHQAQTSWFVRPRPALSADISICRFVSVAWSSLVTASLACLFLGTGCRGAAFHPFREPFCWFHDYGIPLVKTEQEIISHYKFREVSCWVNLAQVGTMGRESQCMCGIKVKTAWDAAHSGRQTSQCNQVKSPSDAVCTNKQI